MLFRPMLPEQVLLAEIAPQAADPERLHPDELRAIARAVPKRRQEFAAGRLLARDLLARAGRPLDALIPDDDRVPRWPSDITGSITHCNSLCAVALTADPAILGLGIDVEPATPLRDELLPQIVGEVEIARAAELPAGLHALAGMLAFCAKEAVYKALYPQRRRFLEFHDVELFWRKDVTDADGGFDALVHVPDARIDGRERVHGRFRIHAGHIGAAVVLAR